MEFSAQQIAEYLKGTVVGDPNVKVSNLSKIEEGCPGTLTFLSNPKYTEFIYTTKASVVLVNKDFTPEKEISGVDWGTRRRIPTIRSARARRAIRARRRAFPSKRFRT